MERQEETLQLLSLGRDSNCRKQLPVTDLDREVFRLSETKSWKGAWRELGFRLPRKGLYPPDGISEDKC